MEVAGGEVLQVARTAPIQPSDDAPGHDRSEDGYLADQVGRQAAPRVLSVNEVADKMEHDVRLITDGGTSCTRLPVHDVHTVALAQKVLRFDVAVQVDGRLMIQWGDGLT